MRKLFPIISTTAYITENIYSLQCMIKRISSCNFAFDENGSGMNLEHHPDYSVEVSSSLK